MAFISALTTTFISFFGNAHQTLNNSSQNTKCTMKPHSSGTDNMLCWLNFYIIFIYKPTGMKTDKIATITCLGQKIYVVLTILYKRQSFARFFDNYRNQASSFIAMYQVALKSA